MDEAASATATGQLPLEHQDEGRRGQPRARFRETDYNFGLNYARSLNFTDEQYEEALKRVDRPDNANQLLVALIDVSSPAQQQQQSAPSVVRAREPGEGELEPELEFEPELELMGQFDVDDKSTGANNCPATGDLSCSSTSTRSSCSSLTCCSCTSSGISSLAPSHKSHHATVCQHRCETSSGAQSLESLSQRPPPPPSQQRASLTRTSSSSSTGCAGLGELRKIYVDGANVAKTHGRDSTFSWTGIGICVDWFRARQHHVRVLVPESKFPGANGREPRPDPEQVAAFERLNELETLVRTPSGCNDDLMIIEAARQNNGVIVSNDQFRDERRRHWTSAGPTGATGGAGGTGGESALSQFVASHRLPYVFVDDLFIPAPDPQGRTGPTLEEFLRHGPSGPTASRAHQKLGKTRSHQSPGARQHNGRGNYNVRGYGAIFRHSQQQQPQQQQHQPQHSFYQVGAPGPDYTSSRQIHSWQGPARPSAFEQPSGGVGWARANSSQNQQQQQTSVWPTFLQREPWKQTK